MAATDLLEHVEYGPEPSVLILGDVAGRLAQAAGHAGFRVLDSVPLADALPRLDRQAGVDVVALEIADDTGPALDRLLDRLAAEASVAGVRLLVVMTPALIDAVSARLGDNPASLLVDPSALDLAAAFGIAAQPAPEPGLRDSGSEGSSLRLIELSEEVGRLARELAALAVERPRSPPPSPAPRAEDDADVSAATLRAMIRARRVRDQFFRADLFADPAWDILLDLAAAAKEGRSVPVSSLCIAAAVPPTTALRWIRALTDEGLLVRRDDPLDGRRIFVALSDDAAAAMDACAAAVRRAWPG